MHRLPTVLHVCAITADCKMTETIERKKKKKAIAFQIMTGN